MEEMPEIHRKFWETSSEVSNLFEHPLDMQMAALVCGMFSACLLRKYNVVLLERDNDDILS